MGAWRSVRNRKENREQKLLRYEKLLNKKNINKTTDLRKGDDTMLIINGVFIEGEKVTVVIDGKQITRTVKYNRTDGLYIVYQNRRYFEYEF